MKKVNAKRRPQVEAEDIPETDFSKGVRGKHFKQYWASLGMVQLDPDVKQHFPDSEAANEGLRELLKIRGTR
jgi:hypothetical protein